jgi:hypothetical protein
MDGIRLDQDGNLRVIMNPQVLKRTKEFLSTWELRCMELVSCDDTKT